MHLGSLESTQEARVALGPLGYLLEQLLRFFRALQNFPRASITRYTHAKHEPILKGLILGSRWDFIGMNTSWKQLGSLFIILNPSRAIIT